MRLPDVEYPPLSSGSSASLDEWFTITREDLGVTAIGRGSDSDDDFVLVASESQKVVSNVQMVKPTFATVSNETHLAATDVANLIPVEETTLSSDLITPGGALTASSPPPPAVIVLNGRKITAPGFNTDAALAFDDRWIGRDLKARRNNLRWYSSGRRKEWCLDQRDLYPLADVVFTNHHDNTTKTTELNSTHLPVVPIVSSVDARIVDAAEELAYRLVREDTATSGPAICASPRRRRS